MGSKYKIGKAFYSTIKESIRDLGKRYRRQGVVESKTKNILAKHRKRARTK